MGKLLSTSKLNNLQVLRGFAAAVVVLYHTGYLFPHLHPLGGFGVDIFFVISGYIMARILNQDKEISPSLFLRRRILRIVPPYWAMTLVVFCFSLVRPDLLLHPPTFSELVKSLLFIPYVKGNNIQPVLFVGWSLNYEMFFYFALAIGAMLWRKRAALAGSVVVLAVIGLCNLLPGDTILARFYGCQTSIEFVMGIICYGLANRIAAKGPSLNRGVLLVLCFASGLALILEAGLLPERPNGSFMRGGIPSFLLVLSASLLSQRGWDSRSRLLVLLGDASYVLYLIHPFSVLAIGRIFGRHFSWLRTDTWSGAPIAIIVSIGLAIAVHLYGERPMIKVLNSRFGGRRTSTEFLDRSPALSSRPA